MEEVTLLVDPPPRLELELAQVDAGRPEPKPDGGSDRDLLGLREMAAGMKQLSAALDRLPSEAARQAHAVEFSAACGLVVGLVIGLLLSLFFRRN